MKKLFFHFVLLLLAHGMMGQITEETRVMSAGSQPALTVILPGADTKFADSEWKDFMKSYGRVTGVRKAKENIAADIQILDIGGVNRLNVYSMSETAAEGTKMVVWIDLGNGFVSSSGFPREYAESVKFLQNFAHNVKINLIAIDLEDQQKALSKFESNLSKLQRENENLHKIIEDANKRIAQAEQDIVQNLANQDLAQKEIESQKKVVEVVTKKLEETKALKPN